MNYENIACVSLIYAHVEINSFGAIVATEKAIRNCIVKCICIYVVTAVVQRITTMDKDGESIFFMKNYEFDYFLINDNDAIDEYSMRAYFSYMKKN